MLRGAWVTFAQVVLVLVFRYATSATAGLPSALNGNLPWRLCTVLSPQPLGSAPEPHCGKEAGLFCAPTGDRPDQAAANFNSLSDLIVSTTLPRLRPVST